MDKTAVITGIRGQDASYLAELLLEKGYRVIGTQRRLGNPDYEHIQHFMDDVIIEQGDVTDFGSIARVVDQYKPDEFYNLAAQSFVAASWDQPISTCEINFLGPCNCMEAIRLLSPHTKFFQASTSEVYGDVITDSQDESTQARPRSPYAASKYGAESLVKVFRESYNMFACYARSFNHESPRRPKQFVTRKITAAIAHMHVQASITGGTIGELLDKGIISPLKLGNIESRRDWSHAKDIVKGIWQIMQQPQPDDFVFASGYSRSVADFVRLAFKHVMVDNWERFITIDQSLFRPAEVSVLRGNATKAIEVLDWKPEISFESLVTEMMDADIEREFNKEGWRRG